MSIAELPPKTRDSIEQLLDQRILVLDGAMGTMVHQLKFGEADFRGARFANHSKDLRNLIDVEKRTGNVDAALAVDKLIMPGLTELTD